jgi:tRNA(Leu) C34 or U34 (ribose-2'-O)-methylase TrmL
VAKLNQPYVITNIKQELVCVLPKGFDFDDKKWQKIWDEYDRKKSTLHMQDLKNIFPYEKSLQKAVKIDENGHDWCNS